MARYARPHSVLTIALLGGLYLVIVMDRYGGFHPALYIPCMETSN
jgi:hypothetical protein